MGKEVNRVSKKGSLGDNIRKKKGEPKMTQTIKNKAELIEWTLESPATPEMIDAYARGFKYEEVDEVEKAARDSAAGYVKRNTKALSTCIDFKTPTIEGIADGLIAHREGFTAGVLWVLERLNGKRV